jgi:hypothetical protein
VAECGHPCTLRRRPLLNLRPAWNEGPTNGEDEAYYLRRSFIGIIVVDAVQAEMGCLLMRPPTV